MKRSHHRTLAGAFVVSALSLVAPGGAALAQNETPAPQAGEMMNPDAMRERLERRLEELRAETARLEQGLLRLQEGAPAPEVFEALRAREGEGGMRRRSGPEHWRGPGPDGAEHAMDAERRARVERFIAERAPQMRDRMAELRERRPEIADRMEHEMRARMDGMMALAEKDPAMFELRMEGVRAEMELRQAALDYAMAKREGADQAGIDGAVRALEEVVARRTEIALREREVEIAHMETRLTQAREELTRQRADIQALVNRRLDELMTRIERMPAKGEAPEADRHERQRMKERRGPGAPAPAPAEARPSGSQL